MAPFKSGKGRNQGKLIQSYSTGFVGSSLSPSLNFSASGGDLADGLQPGNGYAYHTFSPSGTLSFFNAGQSTVECLIVGGGGAGGGASGNAGCGGGGGGASVGPSGSASGGDGGQAGVGHNGNGGGTGGRQGDSGYRTGAGYVASATIGSAGNGGGPGTYGGNGYVEIKIDETQQFAGKVGG